MRKPSRAEMAAIRVAVREVLTAATTAGQLTSEDQIVVAHYLSATHTPGTPWPCMDAVLVLCDQKKAAVLVKAIAATEQGTGDDQGVPY